MRQPDPFCCSIEHCEEACPCCGMHTSLPHPHPTEEKPLRIMLEEAAEKYFELPAFSVTALEAKHDHAAKILEAFINRPEVIRDIVGRAARAMLGLPPERVQ